MDIVDASIYLNIRLEEEWVTVTNHRDLSKAFISMWPTA